MHMLLHRQGHGDGCPSNSHRLLLLYGVGGFPSQEVFAVKHKGCRKTHSQDSSSDRHGIRLSDNLRQKAYCELQVEVLLSMVLSVPTPWGIPGLRQYLDDRGRVPDYTNNYNSSALAG